MMCFSLPGVKEQYYSNNKLKIENDEKNKTFGFIVQIKQVFGKDGNHFYITILIQKKIGNFTYSIRSIVLDALNRWCSFHFIGNLLQMQHWL